jgi:hypothetical protein
MVEALVIAILIAWIMPVVALDRVAEAANRRLQVIRRTHP